MRMTIAPARSTMTETSSPAQWPVFRRAARTVVVVDVVESVRLYEEDEEDTVRRWQAFVGEVVTRLLPQHGGRLVKSLGDGLMLEFEAVPPAIQCAIAMHSVLALANTGLPPARWLCLRAGAHLGDIIVDEHDIQGRAVNLAARLTTLAGPGEIVVSAAVRDRLTAGLDADVEDLGECHFKHLPAPVRAFRVGQPGHSPVMFPPVLADDARPVIAVVPFADYGGDQGAGAIGEALADDIIGALSKAPDIHVISRLSTSALRDRPVGLSELRALLGADYLLSGSFVTNGTHVRLRLELAETRGQRIVWAESLSSRLDELLQSDTDLVAKVVSAVGAAIVSHEIDRARTRPMPSLESYTLLVSAIALMHRANAKDFERSRAMLDHLIERNPREPAPRAWVGKWHVMRSVQGWSRDRLADARLAHAAVSRALDLAPNHAMALTIDGLVSAFLLRDLEHAQASYSAALEANPNESLAWLFSSALHFYRGEGEAAGRAAEHALRLSPLDPMKYYYDTFAATAMLGAGQHERAIELARRSLRGNCMHTATFRTLAIAQVLCGHLSDARETMARMRALEPDLTVSAYLDRFPGSDRAMATRYAEALREAGLPA
jgi:adenylate cyclase